MRSVILHLSDIHFGSERGNAAEFDKREICLSSLLQTLEQLPDGWKPDTICISGDIAYAGKVADYEAAKTWIGSLLEATNLTPQDIIVCPGNHDVVREASRGLFYIRSAEEADKALELPVPDYYRNLFVPYEQFCRSLGIPTLQIHGNADYLIGSRIIHGVRFVVLNSA